MLWDFGQFLITQGLSGRLVDNFGGDGNKDEDVGGCDDYIGVVEVGYDDGCDGGGCADADDEEEEDEYDDDDYDDG